MIRVLPQPPSPISKHRTRASFFGRSPFAVAGNISQAQGNQHRHSLGRKGSTLCYPMQPVQVHHMSYTAKEFFAVSRSESQWEVDEKGGENGSWCSYKLGYNILAKLRSLAKGLTFSRLHLNPH